MATDKELQLREELSRAAVDVAQCRAQLRSARQALSAAELREEELKAQLEDLQSRRKSSSSSDDWLKKQSWTQKLRVLCEDVFGVTSFRTNQEEALNALMAKRDVFLVAPTGAGKSLCFQAPSILTGNLTLVVSPLLSLMQDQVMSLRALGIGAAMLSSNDSREEQTRIRKAMSKLTAAKSSSDTGELRLLYLTPERLAKSKLVMNLLEKIYASGRLGLIAIDEDYERLAALRIQFPKTPILALTATATPSVALDVQKCLQLQETVELRAPTDRANLFYVVRHRPKAAADVLELVLSTIRKFPQGTPGLVYCITRKEAESLREGLSEHVRCAFYHGDLSADLRQKVHSAWVEGEVNVVVATVAFGMGINKGDVRFVIHAGLPASLHHYYQESGRAGRDGKPALCLLLYRPSDVARHSVMNYYKPASLREIYGAAMYCQRPKCRRAQISKHFGEPIPACFACDVCTLEVPPKRQKTRSGSAPPEAWRAACQAAVAVRGQEEQLTLAKLCDRVQKTCKWKGEAATEDAMYVCMSLLGTGYLREEFRHSPYATNAYLVGTPCADRVLEGEQVRTETLELGLPHELLRSAVDPGPAARAAEEASQLRKASDEDTNLRLRRLRKLRAQLGKQSSVPGQFVLSDEELKDLASAPPSKLEEMRVSGTKPLGVCVIKSFHVADEGTERLLRFLDRRSSLIAWQGGNPLQRACVSLLLCQYLGNSAIILCRTSGDKSKNV